MSAFIGVISTAGTEIALVAATAKTVLQLRAPANHRLKVLGWGIYFDGVAVDAAPVQIKLLRQTTDGTMTSVTALKLDDSLGETLLASGGKNATAEPTAGDVLEVKEIHPQQGYEKIYPMGQEPIVGGGDRIGILVTAPAGVNCEAEIKYEE